VKSTAVVLAALLTGVGLAGCAGPPSAPSVSDLAARQFFYAGDYLGKVLTVPGRVAEVYGPTVFSLEGRKPTSVLVVTDQPVTVQKGEEVVVTGTAGQLHPSASSEKAPYMQTHLYNDFTTSAYLYHARVAPR
jgi:hypothetical protein